MHGPNLQVNPRAIISRKAWGFKSHHSNPAIKLLKSSADSKNIRLGEIIHAHLLVSGKASESHVVENNTLLNMYGKCSKLSSAQKLFDGMRMRNVVSWATLMAAYFHNGFCYTVLDLLRSMTKVDEKCPADLVRINKYVLSTVLSCCAENGLYFEGYQCHGYAEKSGLIMNQHVKNALVSMYSMSGDVGGAMAIFNWVPGLDICTYNSVFGSLLDRGYLSEALDVFSRMVDEDLEWDSVSYLGIFALCARLKDLRLGTQAHCRMLKSGFHLDLFSTSAIIDMYGKCGDILSAREIFDTVEFRNVVSWTAFLAACLQSECFEDALKMFSKMELDGVRPNEYTFAVLLNACASLSAFGCGSSLHARVEKTGYGDDIIAGNALINMYSRNGDISMACKIFERMRSRDPVTWNSMICGFSHHGHGREALSVFRNMLAAEEKPNYVTFVGVLSACAHLGSVEEGLYYLHHFMNKIDVQPGLEHYTCIVGLLGKAGKLDEAENFIRSIPVKLDAVVWRTLLNACNIQRNYDVGKRVGEMILQMYPNDVGTCVLLSNIYAKSKGWANVVEMRKLMREKNIKKEPGSSWTEIGKDTHIFVADDNEHPELVQIHKKVRDLLSKIKLLGYVPDLASELHDVGEEQKAEHLAFHSEKLAIAYALLKTPPNASIRVIKNLRMCDDCHSATKLIAKLTNRQIVVRDANRFHTFRDGNCSCSDYW